MPGGRRAPPPRKLVVDVREFFFGRAHLRSRICNAHRHHPILTATESFGRDLIVLRILQRFKVPEVWAGSGPRLPAMREGDRLWRLWIGREDHQYVSRQSTLTTIPRI